MSDNKVSIIIPTKNNGDIIEKCLASIKNLDYPKDKYEMIVVDGHSTDGTVEFAKTYGVHHGLEKQDRITESISKHITLARGSTVGLVIFLAGFVYTLHLVLNWIGSGYKSLPMLDQDIAAFMLLVIGLQTIFYSFFLSVIGGEE
jgi:glycosyltransferase involved in cell wall biosynthesis